MGPSRSDASNVRPSPPASPRADPTQAERTTDHHADAWDSLSGALVEQAGADAVLIGDSLAMVALGHATTLPVTLDEMRHHTLAVSRDFRQRHQQPLLICDLPSSVINAVLKRPWKQRVTAEGDPAAAVKLEAEPEVIAVIDRMVRMGIPVMGHRD